MTYTNKTLLYLGKQKTNKVHKSPQKSTSTTVVHSKYFTCHYLCPSQMKDGFPCVDGIYKCTML